MIIDKILGVLIFTVLSFLSVQAQNNWTITQQSPGLIQKQWINVESDDPITFASSFEFTSLAFLFQAERPIESVLFQSRNTTKRVEQNEHVDITSNGVGTSILYFTDSVERSLILYLGNYRGKLELHLIDSRMKNSNRQSQDIRRMEEGCNEPTSVDQSVWRAGLPAPSSSKAFTTVTHLIVHHSAGSNTSSNWTNVVRAIYTYHTQTNGWADIGYNYLIAPDGTLFNGRDPFGQGDQDDVRGAHFCGKNSNTMGVCIMGTYTSVPPTSESIATLQSLLTWKCLKDNIDPTARAVHSGSNIYTISGHRDGCGTECPGQMTYNILAGIRTEVQNQIDICEGNTNPEPEPEPEPDPVFEFKVYPNPTYQDVVQLEKGDYALDRLVILNAAGIKVKEMELNPDEPDFTIEVDDLPSGIYHFIFSGTFAPIFMRKMIVK